FRRVLFRSEFGGKLNGFIRKASDNQIPLADLEKLTDQEKINKLVELLNANKGKDTEELRKQINDTVEKHNAEIENLKKEYDKKLIASEARLSDYKVSDFLATKVIPKIPLVDGDMKIRTSLLKSALAERFNLVMNDKNELELRDKDNIEKPVIDTEKNAIYQPEQFASEFFTGLGIVKTDNRGSETKTDVPGGGDEPPKSKFGMRAGIDKATNDALAAI